MNVEAQTARATPCVLARIDDDLADLRSLLFGESLLTKGEMDEVENLEAGDIAIPDDETSVLQIRELHFVGVDLAVHVVGFGRVEQHA